MSRKTLTTHVVKMRSKWSDASLTTLGRCLVPVHTCLYTIYEYQESTFEQALWYVCYTYINRVEVS